MENEFRAGDIIKSGGNPNFIYGITHVDLLKNEATVIPIGSTAPNYFDHSKYGYYPACAIIDWRKIIGRPEHKACFLKRLDELLAEQQITNLDYVECLYKLTHG